MYMCVIVEDRAVLPPNTVNYTKVATHRKAYLIAICIYTCWKVLTITGTVRRYWMLTLVTNLLVSPWQENWKKSTKAVWIKQVEMAGKVVYHLTWVLITWREKRFRDLDVVQTSPSLMTLSQDALKKNSEQTRKRRMYFIHRIFDGSCSVWRATLLNRLPHLLFSMRRDALFWGLTGFWYKKF